MTRPLDGKTAVVTGAASGIGRAAALDLARNGAAVVLVDRDPTDEVAANIGAQGCTAHSLVCDIGDEAQVREMTRTAAQWRNGIDVAVNCAGICREGALLESDLATFNQIIATNLTGTYLVGREAIRSMRARGRGGRVINISSELAFLGREGFSAYCASKAGDLGLTRSWAREFAPDILVNAVAPGPVDTPMLGLDSMPAHWIEKESDIPLQRVGRPEEIAAFITFLAGPGASFCTGQAFGANGGAFIG